MVQNCGAAPYLAIAECSAKSVFAHSLVIFTKRSNECFAALQSNLHEAWARFFGSSMKDDLRYTSSDCFETFPFPETSPVLAELSERYLQFRAELMLRNNQGLTQTYNRFHDPHDGDSDIRSLRELHAKLDRAVLDAYGWQDLKPTPEFLLDYEDDESEPSNKRKKPYRLRWPDAERDEVLARLLALNGERAKAEARAGKTAKTKYKELDDGDE